MHFAIFCVFATFLTIGNSLLCGLKYPNCGLTTKNIVCDRGEKCDAEEGCESVESDPEFLKWILHEHNRLRNEIATGKENRGFTGPAANMMALSYDKELEYTASCNANRCKFEHDKCRGTIKFPAAGQNLFYASGNGSEIRDAVTEWFEEIKQSTADVIDKFPREREDVSRFTQMIWAKSTHIGCAQAKKRDSDERYLVCNYGPSGNKENRRVYERGEGCTKCPLLIKCNTQYPALCGKIDQNAIGTGTGGSGVPDNKEEGVTEKAQDKDVVAAGGGGAGVVGGPGVGIGGVGLGGLGIGGGLPGSQGEQDKQDQDDKDKKTTRESSTQQTDETKTKQSEQSTEPATTTTAATTTVSTTVKSTTVESTTVNTTTESSPEYMFTVINGTNTSVSYELWKQLYSTPNPLSGNVYLSSKMFIYSIAAVLLGLWYFI